MKFLFDLLPVILFFIAFKLYDIFVATAAAIVAAAAQIIWLWWRHRHVDKTMWINLTVIVIFGGATLISQDEIFIKWKPTVLYWLLASVLLISSLVFKKNMIRVALERQMELPPLIWNQLNASWIVFFLLMGVVNLYVAFSFSLDDWVTFKLFGATGVMLIFIVLQVLWLGKYLQQPQAVAIREQRNPEQSDRQKNNGE